MHIWLCRLSALGSPSSIQLNEGWFGLYHLCHLYHSPMERPDDIDRNPMWYLYTKVTRTYNIIWSIFGQHRNEKLSGPFYRYYIYLHLKIIGEWFRYIYFIYAWKIFFFLFLFILFFLAKKTFLSHIFCCFCMVFCQQKQPKNGNFWVELGKIVCLVSGNGSLVTHTNWTGSNRGF